MRADRIPAPQPKRAWPSRKAAPTASVPAMADSARVARSARGSKERAAARAILCAGLANRTGEDLTSSASPGRRVPPPKRAPVMERAERASRTRNPSSKSRSPCSGRRCSLKTAARARMAARAARRDRFGPVSARKAGARGRRPGCPGGSASSAGHRNPGRGSHGAGPGNPPVA